MTNSEAIHKVIMFGFNYPQGFIHQVWQGNIANHLYTKFNQNYIKYGASGVMPNFYVNLDRENQQMLVDWILENYKG